MSGACGRWRVQHGGCGNGPGQALAGDDSESLGCSGKAGSKPLHIVGRKHTHPHNQDSSSSSSRRRRMLGVRREPPAQVLEAPSLAARKAHSSAHILIDVLSKMQAQHLLRVGCAHAIRGCAGQDAGRHP
jgi:hypothetical protein